MLGATSYCCCSKPVGTRLLALDKTGPAGSLSIIESGGEGIAHFGARGVASLCALEGPVKGRNVGLWDFDDRIVRFFLHGARMHTLPRARRRIPAGEP